MIVELDKEYDEITQEMSDYINDNSLEIINVGDKFKVIPYTPPKEVRIAQLKDLLNQYDKKVAQHERCHRLGLPCKHDIEELDGQAEAWVKEINELERGDIL